MTMKVAIVAHGGFGTTVIAPLYQAAEQAALSTKPSYWCFDTSNGEDTKVRVPKTVLGGGKGMGKNSNVGKEVAGRELRPHLDAIGAEHDILVHVAMLGGGTGSGFVKYAAEWHQETNKPGLFVVGLNRGSTIELNLAEDAVRHLHATASKNGTRVIVLPIAEDGRLSKEVNDIARNAVNALTLLLAEPHLKQDQTDLMAWMSYRDIPKGLVQLSIFSDASQAEGMPSVAVLCKEDDDAPELNVGYRTTGVTSQVDGNILYGIHAPVAVFDIIKNGREILRQNEEIRNKKGYSDSIMDSLFS